MVLLECGKRGREKRERGNEEWGELRLVIIAPSGHPDRELLNVSGSDVSLAHVVCDSFVQYFGGHDLDFGCWSCEGKTQEWESEEDV